MIISKAFLPVLVAALSASVVADSDIFTALLKRQAPGTPAYDCHDNCGTAITVSKASSNVCSDAVFLYDYNNCLQCAGPDNYNIWKYYGGSLTTAAEKCGLETTPKSGKQEDVGAAKHPGDSASSSSATTEPSSTPSATSSVAESSSAAASLAATSAVPESSSAVTSKAPGSTASVTSAAGSTAAVSSGAPVYTGGASTIVKTTAGVSGSPSPSTNGTASFSSSLPQQTTNSAMALLPNADMMLGAAIVGAMYGLN